MKILVVATDNFRFYHDIVKELKHRDIPFISLSPTDELPPDVDAVITTEQESDAIDHENVVAVKDDVRKGIRKALSTMSRKASYQKIVVGVDPGSRPGIALVGDGKLLETAYGDTPEDVRSIIDRYMAGYDFEKMIVRIGHGDRTNRNRTINSLKGIPIRKEIVNEEYTTSIGGEPDIEAAKEIALSSGELISGEYIVEATEGEQREMQRRSRIESRGEITISRELAKEVVEGRMSLPEAIKKQKEDHGEEG